MGGDNQSNQFCAMRFGLASYRALVTGASSGLGRHFAQVLAQAGAHVVLAARRADSVAALANELCGAGHSASSIKLDVSDAASIEVALDQAGDVDILVNNAGITVSRPVLEQDSVDFDSVIGTNLRGAFLMATAIARRLRDRQSGGSIINIASVLGIRQASHVASYAISKAGVIQMTKTMALELARFEIRVNALAPGYFPTELNQQFWETDEGKALVKRVPQRRLGKFEDLDGPLLLLASDASRFMTGTVIPVDGGHLVSSL